MCGIFGFVGEVGRARQLDLQVALQALHHRGPDDVGLFRSSDDRAKDRGFGAVFAHTRLAIIDLSAGGHQPMTTDDGRYTIVYNGEVFNYREIRKELEAEGECIRSTSDTEVLLSAYARWGQDCLRRLRGMFAFGIWNEQDGSLFLARDRLGVKPLYIAHTPAGLFFASEVRSLLAMGTAGRRLSRRGLLSYLTFGSVYEPATIIEGIESLAPAHTLHYRHPRLEARRFWTLPVESPLQTINSVTIQHVAERLRDAVRLQLIADVPVGIFLSGGMDSSALAALAAQSPSQHVHTFTLTFEEATYDEGRFATEVARQFGFEHHEVRLPASKLLTDIPRTLQALDQPSGDGVNTYLVSAAARHSGLVVALSGLGGDELFAGYSNFRRFGALLSAGRHLQPFGDLVGRVSNYLSRHDLLSGQLQKLMIVLAAAGQPDETYVILRSIFTPTQRRGLVHEEWLGPDGDCAAPPRSDPQQTFADPVNQFAALELSRYLPNTLLRDTDAMSMAHSLEVRVPLLDHLVVEEVSHISGRFKVDRRHKKPLLAAAVPTLPPGPIQRPKMGFTIPFDPWFRGPLRPFMEELMLGSDVTRVGALDPHAVRELWQDFLRGPRHCSYTTVWSVAALIAWCAQNRVSG